MIKNERQHRITKAQVEKFRATLKDLAATDRPKNVHPRLWDAQKAGLKSQMQDLEAELREYESLKTRNPKVLEIDSVEELPKVLVQARIGAGLTQEGLAVRLGVKPQQIQRYEASDYETASFARIREVARLLGLDLRERVKFRLQGDDGLSTLQTPQSTVDELLRIAIEQRRLVRLRYHNRDRVVEPHDYGIQNGRRRLLAYQVGGSSSGRLPNWRWMDVDLISSLEILDRTFKGGRPAPSGKHHAWAEIYASVSVRKFSNGVRT